MAEPSPPALGPLSIVLSVEQTGFDAVALRGGFEDNVARIADLGYDGVELAIRDPRALDPDAVLTTVDRHGLRVPAIGTGQAWADEGLSFTDPDPAVRRAAVDRLQAHVPFAAATGAVVVVGLLRGVLAPGVARTMALSWLADALARGAETAARQAVRIVVEPINRYETPLVNTAAEGLALLANVAADNVGLLLDTFHMNIEERSLADSIDLAASRLWHVHLADSNRWYPGAAHLDFADLLAALDRAGYSGFLSGEFLPEPDPETAARRAIDHLRRLQAQRDPTP